MCALSKNSLSSFGEEDFQRLGLDLLVQNVTGY